MKLRSGGALTLVFFLIGIGSIQAQQNLQSPCPDTFAYLVDSTTRKTFGYIELHNIQVGQIAKLNVDLSIATELPEDNVGSIKLVKSREATFRDILRGQPAQYRVNFPLQYILPTVLKISLNGKTVCTGYHAQGQVVSTINLEHTLHTQLQLANGEKVRLLSNETTYQQPRPQPQPQPRLPQPQTTPRPQIYYQPLQTARPTVPTRPPTLWTQPTSPRVQPAPQRTQSQASTNLQAYNQNQRTTVAPPRRTNKFTCGKPSNSFVNQLSINGELVSKGQFPWIVPLFDLFSSRNPKYICGSTIITRKHLITVAHCVSNQFVAIPANRLLAVPGMYNIDNFFDENIEFAYVDQVFVHEDYANDDDFNDADVAVLRLKNFMKFSENVVPVCAWRDDNDLNKIIGDEGFVAGWGITERGSTNVPTYIKTYVVNQQTCRNNLRKTYPNSARIFCADGRGSVPCNGDSGSGLVIKRGNQYYLRGIVSRGIRDPRTLKCDESKYTIYTDVALFRFWLKQVTDL